MSTSAIPVHPGSVAVVGAGLAGLHAAWRLHEAGIEVVVLEARDRVGGRTWSHTLDDGTVVERGGEFIAPDDEVLRGLCGDLGLSLIPHGFSFDRRPTPEGPAPGTDEVAELLAAARARVAERDQDFPASEAIAPSTQAQASAARRIETSLSVPLSMASARRMFGDDGEGHGYDPAVRVGGGNQSVTQALARRLQDRVRLRTPVVAIDHDERGATVRCAGAGSVSVAAVVVAVPLPLLGELELAPSLPEPIAAAAARTAFGDAAKLHVPLAAAPRPGGVASPQTLWWCWTSQAPGHTDAAPALSGFAGGTEAVRVVAAADGPDAWARMALQLRPDVVPAPDASPLVTHWGSESWTRGSYSAPAVGCTVADDAAWATPWGSIVLAGEHTAGDHCGTMNGAAASGARAANAVLGLLRARGRDCGP